MTAVQDILAALRDATASRHAELDQGMPLARPAATLDDYRAHLALLHRWLAPIEAWQRQYADGPQDAALLPPAPHLPLIEADLADPALPAAAANIPDIADNADPDDPDDPASPSPAARWDGRADPAYRWGVSYVIEGSRLGGAVLYRRLAAALAPHPLRYLHADGTPPGPRWQHFLRVLRDEVREPAAIAAACAGAHDAFDSLIALRRAGAPAVA